MAMKKRRTRLYFVLFSFLLLVFCNRREATEPKETSITIQGTVRNFQGMGIYPAYLIVQDRLLSKTNAQGEYAFTWSTKGSSLTLVCSALNYRDTTAEISCQEASPIRLDFVLTPDNTLGHVYGEFQDQGLFNQAMETNPSLNDWDPKQMFDASTGATMQIKTFGDSLPPQYVYLEDSLLATSDAWGQFHFRLQCGTYPLRATCEGYQDTTQIVKILPGSNYVIFFLSKRE